MSDPRTEESETLAVVGVGLQAGILVLPVGWFALESLGYLAIALVGAWGVTQRAAPSSDAGAFAVLALFGVVRLAAFGVAAAAAVGCLRACILGFRGDGSRLGRAAVWGLAAAVLSLVGSAVTFDCVGMAVSVPPILVGGLALSVAGAHARHLRATGA